LPERPSLRWLASEGRRADSYFDQGADGEVPGVVGDVPGVVGSVVAGGVIGSVAGGVMGSVEAGGGVVVVEELPGAAAGGVAGSVETGGVGSSVGCVVVRPEYWTAA